MKHVLALMLCCLGIAAKAAPTTTIANLNATTSQTPCQSATQVPLYGFDLAITGTATNPNLTGLSFTTTGTYTATDVNKFQLWFNTTNNFATATQLSSNITTGLGAAAHSFAAFSQTMTIGSTYYFWITTDATTTAGASRTVTVSALTTGNITVSTGTKAGAGSAGASSTFSTPVVAIAPASVTRCSNGAGNTLTASGATSYTWSPATGLSATNIAAPATTATTTTTYTVTGTTSGCTATASRLVTVNTAPTVGVSTAGPVCSQVINANGASTYTWAPAAGLAATTGATLTPTPSSNTTYTITGTDAIGCTNTATTTIFAVPTVSITSGNICASGTITASGAVTGGTVTYAWSPATGLAATTGASVSYTGGIYNIYTTTVTSNNGCVVSTTSVAGRPVISSTPTYSANCVSGARSFTVSGASTYTWSPATYLSATTGATVTATPTVAGTTIYTVTATDARSCVNTLTDTSYAGVLSPLPWSEGFETVAANTVQCNQSFGPSLVTATGQEGTGTAATVAAAAGTATGYGATPLTIPARTGSGLAGFGFHASSGSFFTPGFALTGGNTYQFSFWYRIDGGATYTNDYNAYMVYNTTQSMTGATQFANFGTSVVPGTNAGLTKGNLIAMNNATYQQWTGYFTPNTTNNYYFGINGQNNNLTSTYYWTFDDVAFSQASNCVSPAAASALTCSPTIGSATNLTVTSAADSFVCVSIANGSGTPSAGPVNGTNYSIGGSLGGGTIIAKGSCSGTTAAITGYLAPGTSYNFYVYTYQHDSCNGVAYSSTYTTTGSAPSFTTCANSAPTTPTIYSMLPGAAGTANIVLSDLPTTGTVVVHAYTNAAATIPATPASFAVASGDSMVTMTGTSIYTGSNLWFTVDQTISGCTATSSVSEEASVPCTLPWSQGFETGSSLNQMNPNFMQGNLGIYTDQTSATYGGEDNHGATYITPHAGSWEYLFFGGVTTTTAAPGTGAPYIPITVYANQWLVTPGLYCPTAGTYKLSFWYNNASGAFPSIKIQYSTIPTLPSNSSSSMTSGTTIATVTPTVGGGWHQYTTTVTLSAAQTIFIGFDAAALSTSGYMAFDDMEFCQIPTIAVTNTSSTTSVCATGSLSLSATPTPAANQTSGTWNYTWSGPGTLTSTSGAATATGLSTVGMNPTYSVSIINSADVYSVCASATTTSVATITPVPTAVTGSASICGGTTSVFSGGSTVGTPGWSITGAGASYATGTVTSGYSIATTNPTTQKSITVNYSNACGTATPLTVNINVQPVAITASDFISAPPTAICTLASKTFTDNTAGGTWSNSPTAQGTINSSTGVFTSTSTTGTTTLSYTMSTGGCYVTASLPVGTSGPTAITGGAASVCVGATTAAFASTPTGGAWSISNTATATVNAAVTATVTGVANTNGTPVVLTYNTGCGTPQTKSITVNGTSGSITAPTTICTGSTLNISSTGITPTSGTTYAWSGPNTFSSTLASPTVAAATTAANGTYTLTATNGACANTYSATATVAPVPAVPTLTSGASSICGGTTTTLAGTLAAQTAQAFAIPYYVPSFAVTNTLNSSTTWTSGTSNDGYYSASLPFNFSFYGNTYSTVYIGTNGYITFGAGSTLAPATAITAGTPGNVVALFQNDMTLASSGSIQYGTSGTAPNRKFVVSYNAVPGATGGPNTGYIVLNESTNVIDVIVKAFTRNTGANGTCGIANTAGAGGVFATGRNNAAYNVATPEAWRFYSLNNYTYAWTPAAGVATSSTAATTTNALASTTVYTLTVADNISSSCTSSNTTTVTAVGTASASLANTQECIGATSVNMAYSSAVNTPTTYDITWNSAALTANFANVSGATFPGGTSGNIPVSIGNLATAGSTYHGTITFNNAAGCSSTSSFTSAVKTQPSLSVASISVNPSATIFCLGQIVNLNVIGASGSATPYIYSWQGPNIAGTPTTSSNTYTYTTTAAATGAYSVSLSSASSGCNSTPYISTPSSYTLLSSPVPTVTGLTASPTTICVSSPTTLTAGSATGGTQYNWSGPGYSTTSTATSVVMTPTSTANAGTYAVTLTNTVTSCTSNAGTATTIVSVNPLANPGVITASGTTMCVGNSVTLTDTTSGGSWTSSNGSVATVSGGVVTGVAAGTATISYGVANSCGTQYATKVVTVQALPSAISGSTAVCLGASSTMSNVATGGTWVSSNTATATIDATTGVLTAVAVGTTNISYTTTGCGSATPVTVTVQQAPAALVGLSTVCAGNTITLTESVPAGTWSSSNTAKATVSGGVVTGVAAGSATISYTLTNACGTQNATQAITVNPASIASSISGVSSICTGTTATLTDTAAGGTWTSNNTGVATVNSSTGVVTPVAAGSVTISYTTNCASIATKAETIITTPASITGTTTICASSTSTLANTVGGGSWSSDNTSVATISGTGVMSGVAAGSANITYNNSGCIATTAASIIASPSSITGTTTFCQGSNTTLTNAANGGTWSSSNTGVATVDATTGVVTGVATGNATITYSTGCGSAPTAAVAIQHAPTAITGGSSICVGTTVTLSEAIPSGTWSSNHTSIATVDASGVVTGIASGVDTITYSLTNSCGTNSVSQVIPVNVVGKWLGINNNWSDATNWPCGVTPGATVNVQIPAGTAYLPNFTGLTVTVKNLTIDSAVAITVNSGATVNVKGDLTIKGVIMGNGLINMNGSAAQTIYGKGTLYNVTLNNAAGVTINNGDSIKVKGDLTLSAGTLTSNGGLILAVDSVSQGRVAPAAAGTSITGNVTVQQYIPGGRRAFRFFGHPFNGAIALSQIQRTVDVTGHGGTAAGFTHTITDAPSVYWYHTAMGNSTMGYDPGWVAFANANSTTDTNSFKQYEGIRLFVRGSKGEGLNGLSYTPDAAVIAMSGTLNIGAQTVAMRKGAHSDYNQVSNPYPSPTDIGSVINVAKLAGNVTGSAFFVWNPYLGTNGAFEAKPIGGSYVIGMNTSFQVEAAFDGAVLNFAETNKISAADEALLRNASTNQFLSMQVVDANDHAWDNMYFSFNADATNNDDKMLDAGKPLNPDLNFYSLSADAKKLSIDARPFTEGSVIPLGFTTNYAQEYTIKVTNMVTPENGDVYLHDKLDDVYTMLAQGAEYKFEVTADAKTQGEKRFELTTEGKVANHVEEATKFNVALAPNPATDVVNVTFTAPAKANTVVRILDISGVNVVTKDLGAQQNGKIAISINELPAGMYMVEFTSGDYKQVSKLIKE